MMKQVNEDKAGATLIRTHTNEGESDKFVISPKLRASGLIWYLESFSKFCLPPSSHPMTDFLNYSSSQEAHLFDVLLG